MSEMLMIVVMAITGILFAIGGTGYKWARRFVLPAVLLLVAVFCGASIYKSMAMALSLVVALCLPYGSRTPYWLKFIVFMTYGASFLWMGFSLWILLLPLLCFGLFVCSNWNPLSNTFFWKAVEFLYGVLIGITFISVVRHG